MSNIQDKLIPVNLEQEMKKSFISYAMAVIIDRALPDVRDGLKPVHRLLRRRVGIRDRWLYSSWLIQVAKDANIFHPQPARETRGGGIPKGYALWRGQGAAPLASSC